MSGAEREVVARGILHLEAIGCEPRPAGSAAEARARSHAARALGEAGFATREEPFEYSAFPGRYGTPIAGLLAAVTILGGAATASSALAERATWLPGAALTAGLVLLARFAQAMLGDAVLTLPLVRARSSNLIATRGNAFPRIWLVAHLDSKSQPIPSAARVAGIVLVAASVAAALTAAMLQLLAMPHRMGWQIAALLVVVGAPLMMASLVGHRSDGAVDNASGVAAVLAAAARVRPDVALGVLMPSAEELGLAGARAWAREAARTARPGVALNCDGVDDHGELTIMYSGARPDHLLATISAAAMQPVRVRRMPLGLLTDSVAFAERGWQTATVSRGGLATLRRIHTHRDSLAALRGTGIEPAADLLARTVEALA